MNYQRFCSEMASRHANANLTGAGSLAAPHGEITLKQFQISYLTLSRTFAALLLSAFCLLTGCKRDYGAAHKLPSTTDSHMTQMNQINPLTDLATGRTYNSALNSGGANQMT